ncbi:putative glycosyl transferase [groundwater metagenome]
MTVLYSPPEWTLYPLFFLIFFTSIFYLFIFLKKEKDIKDTNLPCDICIIIPAKNVQKTLKKCVESIILQEYNGKISVLIVDDASEDYTFKIAEDLKKNYIQNNRNIEILNRTESNNIKSTVINFGLNYIFSRENIPELIGTLDADSFLGKDVLKNAVLRFNDKKIMVVTSWMVPENKKNFWTRMQKIEYTMVSFFRYLLEKVQALCIAPAFHIFRSEFFKTHNFYDGNTLTEDFEIALRVKSFGYNIAFVENKVTTIVPEKFQALRKQRLRWWYGTFQNLINYKHLISPKYGVFGMFFLPVSVILSNILMMLAFIIIIYGIIVNIFNIIYDSSIGLLPRFMFDINLFSLTVFFSDPRIIFSLFGIIIFVIFMFLAFGKGNEKINFIDYFLFTSVYGWVLTAFCFEMLLKWAFRFKINW